MHGAPSYDPLLVALSILVAIFASFTALNLAGRLRASEGPARRWWLATAALALGGGTWSMHFVGMIAFNMPGSMTYDVDTTLISLALPVVAAGAGLLIVIHFGAGRGPITIGGVVIGLGVVAMHYVGMAAMRMPDIAIRYDPVLVAASVAIALGAATAALWLAFTTRRTSDRVGAAAVMGFAIAGMHYTAMAAAQFTTHQHGAASAGPGVDSNILAGAVAAATATLLLIGVLAAYFDRQLASLTAHEAASLQQSEKRYRALIENASDIIAIMDRDGVLTYESSSAHHILGYRTEELVGHRITEFVPAERLAATEQFIRRARESAGQPVPGELAMQDRNGDWHALEVLAKNLLDEPAIGGIVLNLRDITERKRMMIELERLSDTDALTGMLNRRGFLKRAEPEYERFRGLGETMTIVMIDVDHFKRVNDIYGHAAGDLVLAMVADECRKAVRATDLVARFGGEEFVILLGDGEAGAVHGVVDRLRRALAAARITTMKGEVSVTASFGIAVADPGLYDLETAIRMADEALYEAKNAGRNCIKMRA